MLHKHSFRHSHKWKWEHWQESSLIIAHIELFTVSVRLWELDVSVSSFEMQVHFRNPKREIHREKMGKYQETIEINFQWEELKPKVSMFVAAIETQDVFFSISLRGRLLSRLFCLITSSQIDFYWWYSRMPQGTLLWTTQIVGKN